jgi:hypothetical protein
MIRFNELTYSRLSRFCNGLFRVVPTLRRGSMMCLILVCGSMAAGQERANETSQESLDADKLPPPENLLKIPKLNETKLSSPILAVLQSDPSTGTLQFVVMPDLYGGNVRRGLEMWDNPAVQTELKLTDGQLHKISTLKKDLVNELRKEMKEAMQGVEHLYQAPGFRNIDIQKHEETYAATLEVLTEGQKKRLQVLDRRSRLVQLGWDFVFQLLDRDPETRIPADARKMLEAVLQEKREHYQKLTDERFATFLTGLEDILNKEQVAKIKLLVGSGEFVVRPTIEELAWQLNTESEERFDIERDRLALLRRQKMLALDGSIYDISGSGGNLTGDLARDVIISAYSKIDLLGDPRAIQRIYADRNGPYSLRRKQRDEATMQAAGLYHRGEISEEVRKQRVREARIDFDNYLWKEVMGDLIPGLKRDVDRHLVQLEIQTIGFPLALTQGHLARHVQLTSAQKSKLDKYYMSVRESLLRDTKQWTIELENEIRPLLTDEQVKFLREELAAFDNNAIIHGTPMLMLLPRYLHFPQ